MMSYRLRDCMPRLCGRFSLQLQAQAKWLQPPRVDRMTSTSISRRAFHWSAVASAGGLLASRQLTARAQDEYNDTGSPSYIDMHTHLGQVWNTKSEVTVSV